MAPKIVCVVGPTACGKTTLGVLLAKRFNGEVVSADSMQIYRGMTIGTAAPTAEEMDGVPHHMIAVADPTEQWSAARYARTAIPVVDDILARGRIPILVGGTGLWLEAVVQGRTFASGAAGGEVRQKLQQRLEREGIQLFILSNSRKPGRAQKYAEALGVPFQGHSGKPKKAGYLRAMERMGREPRETVMVGDQIFTDILGANNAGVVPLLVEPIRLAGNPGRYLRYAVETPFRLLGRRRRFL